MKINNKINTHGLHGISSVVVQGVTAIIEAKAQREHRGRMMVEASGGAGWTKLRYRIIQRRRPRRITPVGSGESGVRRNRENLLEEVIGGVTLWWVRRHGLELFWNWYDCGAEEESGVLLMMKSVIIFWGGVSGGDKKCWIKLLSEMSLFYCILIISFLFFNMRFHD